MNDKDFNLMRESLKQLKFVKPTAKEAKEIESAIKKTDKSGKWTSAEELLKKHKAE